MNGIQTQSLIPNIKKRSGAVMPFNQDKITSAIAKAFHATGKDNENAALKIADQVVNHLIQEREARPEDSIPTVEHIQDLVEEELMKSGEIRAAKAYILYRQKRTEERELKQGMLGMAVDTKVGINQLRVLKERYLLRDENGKVKETPEQLWRRVADNIASAETQYGGNEETVKTWSDKFYTLMENMEFMPNTPTLMNAGTPIQQLSACFVLPIDDNIESIYETMKHQALIHQSGGGTGFSFTRIRPKGSMVKSTKGVATGPVGFMSVYNASTEIIKQGGKRRGANMGILRIDHPDIHEFIHCKDDITKINNFNISVALTEKFMQAVENDEEYDLINPHTKQAVRREKAKDVYEELVMSAWKTGDPGIVFIDRINRDNPTPHIGEIEATNPCVTGDTLVSTEKGLMRMKELTERYPTGGLRIATDCRIPVQMEDGQGMLMLMDQNQNQINLRFISQAFSSGIKPVYKLVTKSGYELEATADHKIFTTSGKKKLIEIIPGKDEILLQSQEGSFSKTLVLPTATQKIDTRKRLNLPTHWSKELGQIMGWLTGDGWLRAGDKNCRVGFTFSKADKEVMNRLKPIINAYYGKEINEVERENGVYHLSYHSKYFVDFFVSLGIKSVDGNKKTIPETLFRAPREAVIGYLQGLFTSDGTVRANPKSASEWAALSSTSLKLLKETQILLLNLGIKSRIFNRSRDARENMFQYTNKKGETKKYTSDGVLYELGLFGESLDKFKTTVGFISTAKQQALLNLRYRERRGIEFTDVVESITLTGEKEVYDLTEPATHSMICNGHVVTQCGEQPLLPYDSCNLGSINLVKYVTNEGKVEWERLRETIRTSVRFLDNTIDKNKYVIPQIEKMNKGNRRIGLGVMGWSDLLFKLGISYNSEEGCQFAEKMAKFIREEADAMSQELGKEKGTFSHYKGSVYDNPDGPAFRNCARITIAPTGTISMIADCSSGIEPLFAISFVKRVMDGQELLYVNEIFKETAIKRGFYSEELMEKIAREGTAAHCEEIPEDVRNIFVCAHDISPYWHVRMQGAWQKHVDNGISKTVNFSHNAGIQEVSEVYMLAYKLGCKGVTIYRDGSKGFDNQVLNLNVEGKSGKDIEESYKQKVLGKNQHAANEKQSETGNKNCEKCGGRNMHIAEGCATCMDCGNSFCSI